MDITVLIKTMIRPKSVIRLVKSITKYYPDIKILIADDGVPSSEEAVMKHFPEENITYYNLPQDSGLSYGRNFLLELVETPYFLLCDDDFAIDKNLHLHELTNLLEEHQLDILGGYFRNYKIVKSFKDRLIVMAQKVLRYELDTNYIGTIQTEKDVLTVNYQRKQFPDFIETDLCHNFFLAKTASIKAMHGWDNELKLQEHTEFFLRAKQAGIKVGFTNKMSVKHFPEHTKDYSAQRGRDFSKLFLQKHDFTKAYSLYDESERNTLEYFDENGEFQTVELRGKTHE